MFFTAGLFLVLFHEIFIQWRHAAKSLYNLLDAVYDEINVLQGRLCGQCQTQGAVRNLMRQTDRQQYMGRIQGTGCTCRSAGTADAVVVQQDQK